MNLYLVELPFHAVGIPAGWQALSEDEEAGTRRYIVMRPIGAIPPQVPDGRACLLLRAGDEPLPFVMERIEEAGYTGFACWRVGKDAYNGALIVQNGIMDDPTRQPVTAASPAQLLRWLGDTAARIAQKVVFGGRYG